MSLQVLVPGIACNNAIPPDPRGACLYCGLPCASSDLMVPSPACPLCALASGLARPRIDAEAALIWLPEMSQAALSVLVRAMHLRLRALGEEVHAGGRVLCDTPERR